MAVTFHVNINLLQVNRFDTPILSLYHVMVLSNRKGNSECERSFSVYSKATQQNKLKHNGDKNPKKKMRQVEIKKHGRRKGEGLAKMEQCLFYRKRYGSIGLYERLTNGWRQQQPSVQEV